jgi:hypothetical protein
VVQYDFDPIGAFTQANCSSDKSVGKRHRSIHKVADAAFDDVFALNVSDARTAVRAKPVCYR